MTIIGTLNKERVMDKIIPVPERGTVLGEAKRVINGERKDKYGKPEFSFYDITALWSWFLGERGLLDEEKYDGLDRSDVAMMMVLLKLAREANKHSHDNIVDACGYLGIYDDLKEGKVFEEPPVDDPLPDPKFVKPEPKEDVPPVVDTTVLHLITEGLLKARTKHPIFSRGRIDALRVIRDEFDELKAEVVVARPDAKRMMEEALDTIVTCIRFIEMYAMPNVMFDQCLNCKNFQIDGWKPSPEACINCPYMGK